eukprot:2467185-Prymnesium_polylepis.2
MARHTPLMTLAPFCPRGRLIARRTQPRAFGSDCQLPDVAAGLRVQQRHVAAGLTRQRGGAAARDTPHATRPTQAAQPQAARPAHIQGRRDTV